MGTIQILPPEIVSKIAAGEVIERPASVVKELLENSLDAGATDIEIRVKDAGRSLIRLKDNGSGIGHGDLQRLFHRHATSKLASAEDLYSIHSLGFRGEALYSIAAVADVVLASRTGHDDSGWEVHCRGLQRVSLKPVSGRVGTDIEVKELFFNTPARRKFLKSDATELNHIIDIISPYALLYPEHRFRLLHDTRTLIDLSPAESGAQRVQQAFGIPGEHLIHFEDNVDRRAVAFELLLGDSNIARPKRDRQFIFVNGRPVQNRVISFHMNEAYKSLFQHGTYPFFCVTLSVPYSDVDVNVHPTKREVKIRDEQSIAVRLRAACERTLMSSGGMKQSSGSLFPLPAGRAPSLSAQQGPATPPSVAQDARMQPYRTRLSPEGHRVLFDARTDIPDSPQSLIARELAAASFIGIFLNKYLLFESADSLIIIDQHAAHERITYEKLCEQIRLHSFEIENLLSPILVKAAAGEMLSWEELRDRLDDIGFATTSYDKETIALHSYPRLIKNPERALRSILSGEESHRADPEYLCRRACRSSVMSGERLHKQEAEKLRLDLLSCTVPFTCPHGRPVIIEIKESALSKQFLR